MSINQWNEDRLNEHLRNMDEKIEPIETPIMSINQWNEPPEAKYNEIDVLTEILYEVKRAEEKFPTWPTDIIHAVAIVNKESGEAIRAALQYKYENGTLEAIEKELIQTAAMCLRCLYNLPKF
jgi:hypothetical protein